MAILLALSVHSREPGATVYACAYMEARVCCVTQLWQPTPWMRFFRRTAPEEPMQPASHRSILWAILRPISYIIFENISAITDFYNYTVFTSVRIECMCVAKWIYIYCVVNKIAELHIIFDFLCAVKLTVELNNFTYCSSLEVTIYIYYYYIANK